MSQLMAMMYFNSFMIYAVTTMMRGTLFWCWQHTVLSSRFADDETREHRHDGLYVTIVPLWL